MNRTINPSRARALVASSSRPSQGRLATGRAAASTGRHVRRWVAAGLAAALAGAGLLGLAGPAGASPVLGGQLFGTGGPVTVEVLPAEAGYTSELRLCQPGEAQVTLATNRGVGRVIPLDTFPSGTELVFCIYVLDTRQTYYMGPASRNPDNVIHAAVDATGQGEAIVGFDDSWNAGDRDYNDNMFRFTGVTSNTLPDCSAVAANPSALWPPNHKLVEVTLPANATVTGVTQDEPVMGIGDGNTGPDAELGAAPNKVLLRPERSGTGDGRVYRIAFALSDGLGGSCTGTVTVAVPHDQSKPAVDSGGSFNSLAS
jgi:hypothetical protein